jgi:hypothetical protein
MVSQGLAGSIRLLRLAPPKNPISYSRLAAAGCLYTAVILELSAGQARADDLTRIQGGPTTPSSQPAEWAVRANTASNLKSPSVAFGTRRPTQTPTRSNQRWKGRRLRAGLEPSRPGTGGRQPVDPRPLRTLPRLPRPRPPTAADSAGDSCQAGGETLGPGDGPAPPCRASRPTVRPAERKRTSSWPGTTRLDAEFSLPPLVAVGTTHRTHSPFNRAHVPAPSLHSG